MIESYLIVSFLMVALMAAVFMISGLMVKKAALKVIKTFCEYEALDPARARERGELGLDPPGFFDRLFKPRDYRPHALQVLNQAGIVRSTEDGKLYLEQNKLVDEVKCSKYTAGHKSGF